MLKMIIIDDEPLIRNGLTGYLDWASLGIEIEAVLKNGQEGLEAIRASTPEIVLTDIAMPVMDGVSLLRECRREGFQSQFIFISSYSEFTYAQEAVKYGAFDYLLKPLEASALESCIRRCIAHIQSVSSSPAPQCDWALANELFQGALMGLSHAEASLRNLLIRQKYWDRQALFAVGLWESSPLPEKPSFPGLFCPLPPQCAACLLFDESEARQLSEVFPEALWQTAPYQTGLHALLCQTLLSIWLAKHEGTEGSDIPISPAAWRQEITALARKAQSAAEDLSSCAALCRQALEGLWQRLKRIESVNEKEQEIFEAALRHSPTQTFDLFEHTLNAGLGLLASLRLAGSLAPYTRKAVAIIETQYDQSLSLGSVARRLGISKSHLSATFKADMGCSFSDYLFQYRMRVAKALLEENHYKVYEIGEKVGYPDVAQFSKRFKQYYAVSPRDMHKRL